MIKKLKGPISSSRALKIRLKEEYTSKFMGIKKILQGIEKKCRSGNRGKIDNLYNILTKEAIYVQGLGDIKANKGISTKGIDNQVLDGMDMSRIRSICEDMKSGTFRFQPFRRVYIPKPGKKVLRPLGIPNFRDRLVQSAIKIILETIYEPDFESINKNYGFRPNKSCHDVIERIKYNGTACKFALEGDIVGAYNNVNIKVLMKILGKRIADNNFLRLIEQGCYCGLIDMGQFKDTLIGVAAEGATPRGYCQPHFI